MRNHDRASGKVEQRDFQRPQGINVEIIGRFIEQQNVCTGHQRLGQMQSIAFATGEVPHLLLLINTLEVEARQVRP